MSVRAKLSAIAILASSLLLPLAAPNSAAAETCLTGPKGQAPAGSHWFYRIERPSMRKCWRLVAQGRESAAPRTASRSTKERLTQKAAPEIVPQGDIEDETDAAPAPTPPAVRTASPQLVTAQIKPAQGAVINDRATRDVSSTSNVPLPLPPPAPSSDATPRADNARAPAPLEQTAQSDGAPMVIAEQQPVAQPLATGGNSANASASDGTPMLSLLPAVLALLGLAGGGAFYVTRMMRRRSDVLTVVRDTDGDALEVAAEAPLAPKAATFAPLPPMDFGRREDDVDEALRRFAQNWKRRAA